MKIIISHDVDHWKWREHLIDAFLLKYIARYIYFTLTGRIPVKLGLRRLLSMFDNKISHLEELLDYESELGIKSTVFVGVENGLGLSYSLHDAKEIVSLVKAKGFDVGIHGMAYDNAEKMKIEKEKFLSISEESIIGIRNHYLRMTENTLTDMADLGYSFDSTHSGCISSYKIKEMHEFPISIMDVNLIRLDRNDLEKIKKDTLEILRKGNAQKIDFFTINFHDNYFSELYPDHKAWFIWLIDHLKNQNYEFTRFYSKIASTK